MVEVTIESYIVAGVFALIGALSLWAWYHYLALPPSKRPGLGVPGINTYSGGRMRLK